MKDISQVIESILSAAAERAVNRMRDSMNLAPGMANSIRRAVCAITTGERAEVAAVVHHLSGHKGRLDNCPACAASIPHSYLTRASRGQV